MSTVCRQLLCFAAILALATTWPAVVRAEDDSPAPTTSAAATSTDQAAKIEMLMERIHDLEQRLATVEKKEQSSANYERQLEILKELQAKADQTPILTSTFDGMHFKLYGYLKADGSIDTSRTNNADAPVFVLSPSMAGVFKGDEDFSMTARQSRIGLIIDGPKAGDFSTKGRIEVDFYNGPLGEVDEMRPTPRLRLAYIELSTPATMIRAGQDWDVASPLNPDTLNYGILGLQGNMGYRRPQARITQRTALDSEKKITWINEASINRNSGQDAAIDEGVDSGLPLFQGRTAVRMPGWTAKPVEVGLSGHWGREQFDTVARNANNEFPTYSGNLDWSVPLCEKWAWKGEFFAGKNLDVMFGGIGQGVNRATWDGIRAIGGWSQISFMPMTKLTMNAGYGLDDPNDEDLSAGMRERNQIIYANAIYQFTKQLHAGIEVSHMWTDYVRMQPGEALRVQSSLWFYF